MVERTDRSAPGPHADAPVLDEKIERAGEGPALGLILVHGRGAAASGMLPLGRELVRLAEPTWAASEASTSPSEVRIACPQAADRTWYPGSFLEPLEHNEPWLSSALALLESTSADLESAGIPRSRQVLAGFSQGACLVSEFAGRNVVRWGGLLAFTGGFQGPESRAPDFVGDFDGTPMFFGTGTPDPHVPLRRVEETADLFARMGATVDRLILPGRPHTISAEEMSRAAALLREPV